MFYTALDITAIRKLKCVQIKYLMCFTFQRILTAVKHLKIHSQRYTHTICKYTYINIHLHVRTYDTAMAKVDKAGTALKCCILAEISAAGAGEFPFSSPFCDDQIKRSCGCKRSIVSKIQLWLGGCARCVFVLASLAFKAHFFKC